ncbi:MAG: hypothetical protein LKF34_05585 [Acidaminococcaceae bacterium]|nr:hypothetical protein [Acidaminococcaceae bacterium]
MIDREETIKVLTTKGKVVQASVSAVEGGFGGLAEINGEWRFLALTAKGGVFSKNGKDAVVEDREGEELVELPLNSNNAALVRRYMKMATPTACGVKGLSVGFTDYLGLVTPVLPQLFAQRHLKPVLVETSTAVSKATGTTLLTSIDAATWSAVKAGLKNGYGATINGIYDEMEFLTALLYMYSCLGFDGAHWAAPEIAKLPVAEVEKKYQALPEEFRKALEASYLNAEFKVGNTLIKFAGKEELERIVLVYAGTIMHTQTAYDTYFRNTPWPLDLEVDLSRAGLPLTPAAHYLIINELERNGVKPTSICIDAKLDPAAVTTDLSKHAAIAATFGYRLSINNADLYVPELSKVAKVTGGKVHFKLNNVLWLAVLATLAAKAPDVLAQAAAQAGLPVPTAANLEPGAKLAQQYAAAYAAILGAEKDHKAVAIPEAVRKNLDVYEQKVTALVGHYLNQL